MYIYIYIYVYTCSYSYLLVQGASGPKFYPFMSMKDGAASYPRASRYTMLYLYLYLYLYLHLHLYLYLYLHIYPILHILPLCVGTVVAAENARLALAERLFGRRKCRPHLCRPHLCALPRFREKLCDVFPA